ncbi:MULTISPECIES: SDR family NAD(P)-dependent oxidoreductase [Microbacterium]|uniref:NAD(P)-dependent dehydrogenase, short-chain alcohol dehydrogenase family n=1 Tax=Microbacterium saccharophilum TaxID=1213358 RepID=A0A7Z7GE34_9MICO|nr:MULTISPECIES: SDR family NAD(P)-dependent oxidoreductase [Microbacterium]SFI61315.1 NAD(P)-dependent dehydrogenase, short-chain alcohol dehydrogenase family [Microbacterium saccharophilum]
MTMSFEGRVAVVTGGASGIGAATVAHLATRGAQVVVSDIDPQGVERVARELSAQGRSVLAHVGDSSDPAAAKEMVERAVGAFGHLHLAVNNAGIASRGVDLTAHSDADWHSTLDVNLSGVFYGMRAQIPAIVASGGGAIVNVASIMSTVSVQGSAAYTAAKHGVLGLTRTAALEFADSGIRINAVAPGYVETPMMRARVKTSAHEVRLIEKTPMGRLGRPAEIASVIGFLLGDDASFVTGALYPADGGYTAQ